MTQEEADLKVILLTAERSAAGSDHVAKVRAAGLVSRQDSMDTLAETVMGHQLAEAV